jgi:hypothetical protein
MNPRVLATGLVVIALVAVVLAAASGYFGYRRGGPIGVSDAAGVIWRASPGESFTWAMPLPDNPTASKIEIVSIAPDGVKGLEVLGALASEQGCAIPSISLGYPPPDVSTRDPSGAVIGPLSKPCAVQTIVGVRRASGDAPGMIEGLRIRYRVDGIGYEDVLPWSLEVKDPGS